MSKPSQPDMNPDFLDGIDDQFQRLMKRSGNGKRNGRPNGRSNDEGLVVEIIDRVHTLSRSNKEQVLAYILSLEQKASE